MVGHLLSRAGTRLQGAACVHHAHLRRSRRCNRPDRGKSRTAGIGLVPTFRSSCYVAAPAPLFSLTSWIEFTASGAGTSNRRHWSVSREACPRTRSESDSGSREENASTTIRSLSVLTRENRSLRHPSRLLLRRRRRDAACWDDACRRRERIGGPGGFG